MCRSGLAEKYIFQRLSNAELYCIVCQLLCFLARRIHHCSNAVLLSLGAHLLIDKVCAAGTGLLEEKFALAQQIVDGFDFNRIVYLVRNCL